MFHSRRKLILMNKLQVSQKMNTKIFDVTADGGPFDFVCFLKFMIFLNNASHADRAKFVFKLIAELGEDCFTFFDLERFYIKVQSETNSNSSQLSGHKLASRVFEILGKSEYSSIDVDTFSNFLLENRDCLDLFNVSQIDAATWARVGHDRLVGKFFV